MWSPQSMAEPGLFKHSVGEASRTPKVGSWEKRWATTKEKEWPTLEEEPLWSPQPKLKTRHDILLFTPCGHWDTLSHLRPLVCLGNSPLYQVSPTGPPGLAFTLLALHRLRMLICLSMSVSGQEIRGGRGGDRAEIRHFLPSVSLSEVTLGWLCPYSSPGELCVALSFFLDSSNCPLPSSLQTSGWQ